MEINPYQGHKIKNLIRYRILEDGTCSYCGFPAGLIELPDGDVTEADYCRFCDSYNEGSLVGILSTE